MPIPQHRQELIELIESAFAKLEAEVERVTPASAETVCVDDWTVKQVLAIRAWWSERVVDWVESGRRGERPDLPARGYKWNETPRLNAAIAESAAGQTIDEVRDRLKTAYERVLMTIDTLNDEELLAPGVYDWAGKWPLARWFSINTARQYTTARSYIRRALDST